jgi:hypothetical protein
MDPDSNLEEQKLLALKFIADRGESGPPSEADVVRLSELVLALDQWLRSGGFLPSSWQRS